MGKIKTSKTKTDREVKLEAIIRDIFWMGRRYAEGRSTYAPIIINEALLKLEELGVDITEDYTLQDPEGRLATEGMYGKKGGWYE